MRSIKVAKIPKNSKTGENMMLKRTLDNFFIVYSFLSSCKDSTFISYFIYNSYFYRIQVFFYQYYAEFKNIDAVELMAKSSFYKNLDLFTTGLVDF
jgi:hypothetical protein